MSEDVANCAKIVQSGDPDRFLSAMTASGANRDALMVLYAFNVEVSRAPWVTQEPMIAEMRLQWWLDAVEEVFEGKSVRRHEVVTPLSVLIEQHDLPRDRFEAIINARQWDIYKEPFSGGAALEEYLANTGGALMGLACSTLGGPFDPAEEYGSACAVAALLSAAPALEATGRYPLVDGTPGGISELAVNALDRMRAARQGVRNTPRSARAALRAGWMAEPVLKQAQRTPQLVAAGELGTSEARKKFRLMRLALSGAY